VALKHSKEDGTMGIILNTIKDEQMLRMMANENQTEKVS
jgi:putative AlgH/UPF0301 family transcriptional regulator